MKKLINLLVVVLLGSMSSVMAQEMDEAAMQESNAIRMGYLQMQIEERENSARNSSYAHTVTLIPNYVTEQVVPLAGVTTVSDGMFGLAVKSGARDRIVDSRSCKLKSCLIFSCDYELERGKILNISDNEIVVRVTYIYNGYTETEEKNVLPRTFSRILSDEGVQKIICTFN